MQIEHYTSSSGAVPTLKFLKKLPDKDHVVQILSDIELLERIDLIQLVKSKDVEKIKGIKPDIWELKTSCRNKIYRTFFEIFAGTIHIVNIFNKKDQKTRLREIRIAISRLKYTKK
jgi:phage-related protein